MTKPNELRKFTPEQEIKARAISNCYSTILRNFIAPLFRDSPKFKDIYTLPKGAGEGYDKDEFGFYHNDDIYGLIRVINHFEIKSIADLGSGPNYLLSALLEWDRNLQIIGYENEEDFIKVFRCYGSNPPILKDILKLEKKDVEFNQALYFWEPLRSKKSAKAFVDNLIPLLNRDQIIIYRRSGHIGEFLDASLRLNKLHFSSGYEIYKVL